MNAKKLSATLLVIAVVALLVLFAFHVRVGATTNSIAVLKTQGMTCESCSSKITKALESLNGVAAVEVDVNSGWVIIGYDTKNVKPERLAEKVSAAGFNSYVHEVLPPEQFRQITGRNIGQFAMSSQGCCGNKGGGCPKNKQN